MPWRVFANTSSVSWTPSDDGIANGTVVRAHAVGSGGRGGAGDGFFGGGGGGGSGERRSAEFTITTASDALNIVVDPEGGEFDTVVQTGDMMTQYVVAKPGLNGSGLLGGDGGTGGTGTLVANNGAAGGASGADSGGGGAGAAGDASAGNAGASGGVTTGGAGGAGQTQFGAASAGTGGAGGNSGNNGSPAASLFGSGGGGGAIAGTTPQAGKQALVVVAWGDALTSYPLTFADGYVPDSAASTANWFLLLGR